MADIAVSQSVIPTQAEDTRLTATSYTPAQGYTWDDWINDGSRFAGVGRSLLWWIGDWALYG